MRSWSFSDNACGSTAVEDECGVCGGDGIADGACDCDGNVDLGCGCGEAAAADFYDCDGNCLSDADADGITSVRDSRLLMQTQQTTTLPQLTNLLMNLI